MSFQAGREREMEGVRGGEIVRLRAFIYIVTILFVIHWFIITLQECLTSTTLILN